MWGQCICMFGGSGKKPEILIVDGLKVVEWLSGGERNRFLPVILVCKRGGE